MIIEVFIIIFIALLIAGVVYLSSLSPDFEVREFIVIDADKNTIFDYVLDFKKEVEWSPWIMHERDVALEYSDNPKQEGSYYNWSGDRIGEGRLEIDKIVLNKEIEQIVTFIKPFKSSFKINWLFEEEKGKIKVSWIMKGNMPFFFKPMIPMINQMTSKDYQIGLNMLNQILDKKASKMQIDFVGEENYGQDCIIYKNFKGNLEAMQKFMGEYYNKLFQACSEHNLEINNNPIAIYNKAMPPKYFDTDIAIPIKKTQIKNNNFKTKSLKPSKYFRVDLKGDYKFLELAWYSAFAHIKMRKLKYNPFKPSLEVYMNDVTKTKPDDLHTCIYIPIK